jgi:putative tryptophan/tyrosine transport system substrate-binding protein
MLVGAGRGIAEGSEFVGRRQKAGGCLTRSRRDLMALLGGAAVASPLVARAQQPKTMPVIGYLSGGSASFYTTILPSFHEGLSETGYVEGKNVAIEYRWAEGQYDRLPAMAAELVSRKVDLIVAGGGDKASRSAKNATATIPIVFSSGGDPVADGRVASLARPGGNLTGVSFLTVGLYPKRLQLLSELVPQAKTIAMLANANGPNTKDNLREVAEAAAALGKEFKPLTVALEADFAAAFASLEELKHAALIVQTDPFIDARVEQLIPLAARYAVPAIYGFRRFPVAGGLMSYGASIAGVYRQVGVYAGKILAGAKPADLPVQQPTKFELVINLKTAKALGLTVPQSLLARADEVIE